MFSCLSFELLSYWPLCVVFFDNSLLCIVNNIHCPNHCQLSVPIRLQTIAIFVAKSTKQRLAAVYTTGDNKRIDGQQWNDIPCIAIRRVSRRAEYAYVPHPTLTQDGVSLPEGSTHRARRHQSLPGESCRYNNISLFQTKLTVSIHKIQYIVATVIQIQLHMHF